MSILAAVLGPYVYYLTTDGRTDRFCVLPLRIFSSLPMVLIIQPGEHIQHRIASDHVLALADRLRQSISEQRHGAQLDKYGASYDCSICSKF